MNARILFPPTTATPRPVPAPAPDFRLASLPLAIAAAILLAGCSVGPNYHAPRTEVPAAFANGAQTNLAPNQVAWDWWRGFHDPELDRLVGLALATNQDLRIATARVREARALRNNAVADFFPVVGANAGYTRSLNSADGYPIPLTRDARQMELYNAGFDATWELDVFGGVRRRVEASSAILGATEADRQAVLVSLTAEVARNYFELRGAQNQLDVARQNVENERETLELAEDRLRAGRATEFDTTRARSQLETTLAAVPLVEASIKHSIYRLGVLTGRLPAALEAELARPAPIPPLPPLVNIGDPAALLRRRPDIRSAEYALAAATARIGVETASLFPRVFFNGNVGVSANSLSRVANPNTGTYSFGPQITWSALDLGHVLSRMKAARARADGELAAYEKTVLTALEETEGALVDFNRQQARRDLLRSSDQSATRAMALARRRYEGGLSDFLPVLDAQRTQLEVQAQLARSETVTATSLVSIYKALGGGWEIEEANAQTQPTVH
jgi:multidrug efflux system outer membrane protein